MKLPPVHVVATDDTARTDGFLDLASQMMRGCGASLALHLRLRHHDASRILRLAAPLAELGRRTGGWCVLNDRVDVALAAGAQAVQLGSAALPVEAARRILPPEVRIGASVHGVDEAMRRAAEGADYLLVGTIFPSVTHPHVEAGGTERLRTCAAAGIPIVAIGGVTVDRVARVREAGAAGIAVVGAVWSSADPLEAAAELCSRMSPTSRESEL